METPVNIHYATPYRADKDLGKAYNDTFKYLLNTDITHVCLMDGDIMFLTPNWGTIIQEYVEQYPNDVLTCRTNRIHHLSKQLLPGFDLTSVFGMIIEANQLSAQRTITEILPGEGMSGFLMVVPVEVWKQIPFVEGIGCLGVDSCFRVDLHRAESKTLIMDGLLVYHIYRLATGVTDKSHLL